MATTVSFLFWNIRRAQGTRFHESLRRLAVRGIDVFLFAEPPEDDDLLLDALNRGSGRNYQRIASENARLRLFSRLDQASWVDRSPSDPGDRFTAHEVRIGDHPSLLLIAAHLHAANNLDIFDRADWARELVADLRRIEVEVVGHTRTILVGDLNMNPFDRGLVDTSALHAVLSIRLAESVRRMKSRRGHPPFYNPMWSLLGDRAGPDLQTKRAAGTYFYESSQARASHFWQMFDQVLLRPELMNTLTRLEILDSDGEDSLVSRSGRPRRVAISDHLPLSFDLTLSEGES